MVTTRERIQQLSDTCEAYKMHLVQAAIRELHGLGYVAQAHVHNDGFHLQTMAEVKANSATRTYKSFTDLTYLPEGKPLALLKLYNVTLFQAQIRMLVNMEKKASRDPNELSNQFVNIQKLLAKDEFYKTIQAERHLQLLKGKTHGEAFISEVNDIMSQISYSLVRKESDIQETFINNSLNVCRRYHAHLMSKFFRDGERPDSKTKLDLAYLSQRGIPESQRYLAAKVNFVEKLIFALEESLKKSNSIIGSRETMQTTLDKVQQLVNFQGDRDAICRHGNRMTAYFSYSTDPMQNEVSWWSIFAIPTESTKFLISIDRELKLVTERWNDVNHQAVVARSRQV